MMPCPTDEELRRLLGGQLTAEAADPLTRHTDGCAACQRRLEQLLDDPAAGRWRSLLRPAPDEAAPTKLAPGDGFDSANAVTRREGGLVRRLRADPARRGPPPPPAPPGYEVLEELGRGGMGVVYKARQTALRRLVALKVIGSGAWAGPGEVVRFRAEAEAVARLQHPNIVQVYEIGEHDGRPFFSLEYVDGGSLADRLDGTPLAPPAAAELVRTMALAMHAAHERGIVHRDLKPANVLLAACGLATLAKPQAAFVPKIADFGLAKRLGDDSGLTQTGTVLGTPSYMAPEQAGGHVHQVGPAADTYALGAILYELLAGRPPFRGATPLDTLQQVKSQPPVAPTRLQPQVPRDLETICLKCLEKEPHKRYPSARGLADDLQHFLAGEPILARPATLLERGWKWAKRRPAVALLLLGLCSALAGLFGGGTWSYFQLSAQATRLSAQATRLKQRNEDAQRVVEDMYTNVAEEWLADEPQKDPIQRKFLEKALKFYRELVQEDATDPEARRRTALAYFRMGQLHRTLNQRNEAADAYRQAIDMQDQLRRQFPDEPRYRQDLANSHNWLGELQRDGGSLKDAQPNFLAALKLQQALHAADSAEPSYRRELARSHSNLGLVEMDTDRATQAGRNFDRAVGLLEQLVKESPATEFRHELARTLTNRGVFLRTHKQPRDAETDYRRAIRLLNGLRATGRVRAVYEYNLAIAHLDLGNILYDREDYDQALAELDQAEEILTRLVADFPARTRYKKKLARTYNSRGSALAESGEERSAEDDWRKAQRLLRKLVEEDPNETEYLADLGKCTGNLGLLRFQQGDLPTAGDDLKEAVRLLRAALAPNPMRPDYREALRDHCQSLAEVLVRAEERDGAVKAAADLAGVFPERALDQYYAACFTARCVPLDEKANDKDGASDHAKKAARLLQQALDRGLTGQERLAEKEEGRIFGPLARRRGWTDLLKKLEARPRPARPGP
jgi:tetratricopeptide (TPR) repeat protein